MKRIATFGATTTVLVLAGFIPVATGQDVEEKAAVCAGCHGPGGHSAVPDNPILAGQHADYLGNALRAYLSGTRDYGIMKTLAGRLSAEDIEDLSAYYASQPGIQSGAKAAGDAAAGEAKVTVCAGCHGPGGNSLLPVNPSLAGQHAVYLAKALTDYRDGSRKDPTMSAMAAALSDKDIEDIAAYYAAQPPRSTAADRLPGSAESKELTP